MREVLYSKLVFIDSHDGVKGHRSLRPTFHLPTNAFECGQNESMRMVLKSFTMPKCWYDVNMTNNTFFYRLTDSNVDKPFTIAPGNYFSGGELASAIQVALRAEYTQFGIGTNESALANSFTCTYNARDRKLSINIPTQAQSGYFVSYFDKAMGHSPNAVNQQNYYSDAHELLGGTPSVRSNPVRLFDESKAHIQGQGATLFASKYPIRLNPVENIFLRCSAQSDAYASSSHEPFKTGNKLDHTDIWAVIPNVENSSGNVVFVDANNDYELYLKQNSISTVQFDVSDGKGRELPLVALGQAEDGNMNFTLAFQFQLMSELHEARIVPQPTARYQQPPQMTR